MAQLLPTSDTFAETGDPFGWSPQLYIRALPYSDITFTVGSGLQVIAHVPGHLYDFYQAFGFGDAAVVGDSTAPYRPASMFLERSIVRSQTRVTLDSRLKLTAGAAPTDFDVPVYGVWCKVKGGTKTSANTVDEYWADIDGYAMLMMNRSGAGHKVGLFRVNAGVLTLLFQRDVPAIWDGADALMFGAWGPTRIWLECTGSSPVNLKGYIRIHTNGQIFDWLAIDEDDADVSRITGNGRSGFSLFQFGDSVVGGNRLGHTAQSFHIEDITSITSPVDFLIDEFDRRDRLGARTITDDLSNAGFSLMSRYTGDAQSRSDAPAHHSQLLTDIGNSRAKLGDNLPGSQSFGWYIGQREAPSADQHRSLSVNFVNFAAVDAEAGIALRFTNTGNPPNYTGSQDNAKQCYLAAIVYDGTGGTFTAELRHYTGTGAHIVIATASVTWVYGTASILDFECQNTDGQSTRPAMRVKVDSTALTWTAQVAGVIVDGEWVLDNRSEKIFFGLGEGWYFSTAAVQLSEVLQVDTWTELALSDLTGVGDTGDDDSAYGSIAIASEISGALGTLDVPESWPVVEHPGDYQQERMLLRADYRVIGSRQLFGRRSWRVHAVGVTSSQRTALLDFAREHKGPEIPFLWTTPLGELVFAAFADDRIRTTFLAPFDAYQFDLRERFSPFDPDDTAEAGFNLYTPVHPEGTATFTQARKTEGDASLTITVALSSPAPLDDTRVAYTVEGDAEVGVHYTISGGATPLTFAEGESTKDITVTFPAGTTYFLERLLTLKLDPDNSSAWVTFAGDRDEYRVYIACNTATNPPPLVDFNLASSSWSGAPSGIHSVQVDAPAADTQEKTYIWYEVDASSTAVEGVDYTLTYAPGIRWVKTDEGVSSFQFPVQVLNGYTPGRTIVLNLLYEASSGADMNRCTFTASWDPEMKGLPEVPMVNQWPGDPTVYSLGPSNALDENSPLPIRRFVDPLKVHPQYGTPLDGWLSQPGALASGYVRNNAADEFSCDGEQELFPIPEFQRYSVYVELPSASSEASAGPSQYIRISLRDRGFPGVPGSDISHVVIFDRDSPDGGLITRVDTSTGRWGVFNAFHAEGAAATNQGVLTYGVEQEGTPPNDRTRLWVQYEEKDTARLYTSRSNRLIFPINYGSAIPGSGTPTTNANKGILLYDQFFEFSTVDFGGPGTLPFPWPRARSRWEPRGNGFLGTTTTHTVTL